MINLRGYSVNDVVIATGIILLVTAVIVAIANPFRSLAEVNDKQRGEDVKNLTEMLLVYWATDPEGFSTFAESLADGPMMIGTCETSIGANCSVDLVSDCVDLSEIAGAQSIPIDPKSSLYSPEQTGYYLSLENGLLTVGSCAPQLQDEIKIESRVREE